MTRRPRCAASAALSRALAMPSRNLSAKFCDRARRRGRRGLRHAAQRPLRHPRPRRRSPASGVRDAIVHGASATGQTVFVEPLVAIELNNKLVQLAEDEAAEIARILAELTDLLRAQAPALRHAADVIAELDSLFARARYAREFDCALPCSS